MKNLLKNWIPCLSLTGFAFSSVLFASDEGVLAKRLLDEQNKGFETRLSEISKEVKKSNNSKALQKDLPVISEEADAFKKLVEEASIKDLDDEGFRQTLLTKSSHIDRRIRTVERHLSF